VILGLAAVFAVLIVFAFFTNESSDSTPTPEEKTKIAGEKNDFNDLPTATTTAAGVVNPSPTKSVVIGDLDWTKNASKSPAVDLSKIIKFSSAEEEARFNSGDPCAIAGLDDNWSDPFGKTMCGMTRFIYRQVFDPLNKMACNFSGAAMAANYGSNIEAKFVNQTCYILDRQ